MDVATQSYFQGVWQMVRIIEDVPDGVIGEFWGDAVFSPDGEGLSCREAGVLRFRGSDYHAERTSLWRFPDNRVEVRYADGREFHDFDPSEPEATHLCEPDRYEVAYDFEATHFISRWQVKGPQKNYLMTTVYRRAPGTGGGA
ncbi:MAG: DUF6314 family protein [Pseudomonadota bacterium]